jgi:hypothetical protein
VPRRSVQGRAHNTWRNSPYVAASVTHADLLGNAYVSQNSTLGSVSAVGTSYE